MMFKTVPFNLHVSNFQSLMMHVDYMTVVGFRVTFGYNLSQTICFYCYEKYPILTFIYILNYYL